MAHFRFHSDDPEHLATLAKEFRSAAPFPHLVLHDVIVTPAGEVLAGFPDPEWRGWAHFRDAYQVGKMYCSDIDLIPEPLGSMIHELTAPPFLEFLEAVTGIEKLIPDPYLEGGGLHCSGRGGILAPHTDFHIYRRLELYRRINVLVYLNPEWKEEAGGLLELWEEDASRPTRTVAPSWGTCVIFGTDDRSVHGFSKPVAKDGLWRRSIALYYYTSQEAESFSGDTNTYWKQHGELRGFRRVRFGMYRALLLAARSLSFLAHRVNPNVGSRSKPR